MIVFGRSEAITPALTPIAMVFVRCRDGLSHHPDEYAAPQDLTVALRVVMEFLQGLAEQERF